MKWWLSPVAAVLVAVSPATSQDSTAHRPPIAGGDVFEALLEAASGIHQRPSPRLRDPQAHLLASEIRTAVSYLREQWMQAGQPALSTDYLLTLQVNLEALQAILSDTVSTPIEILQHVRDDLELKVTYAGSTEMDAPVLQAPAPGGGVTVPRRLGGYRSTYPTAVRVRVITLRNGKQVGGYWVRTNPKLYGVTPSAIFPFSSVSSPTERPLPPGDYYLWLVTSSGAFVKAQPVTVGATGQRIQDIYVVVP